MACCQTKSIEKQAEVFKALGHPTRLKMVKALIPGERCVCELQALCPDSLPTISRHLSVLKNAGIVSTQKRGLNVFYRLELTCLIAILDCLDSK